MNKYYPELFKPLVVGNTVFKNRLFGAPHYGGAPFPGASHHSQHLETYAEEARGGVAQVTIGDSMIDPVYGVQPWEHMVVSEPDNTCFLGEAAAAIHQFGAKAFIELDHPGMFAAMPNPIGPSACTNKFGAQVKEMDEELMQHVIKCFVDAAVAMKKVGFDGVLLHAGHGWLLQEFISPLFNHRTDEYGGSAENRSRFPMRVCKSIREAVGNDFIIEYRVSANEYSEGGLKPADTAEVLKYIEPYIDMVNVSGGLESDPMLTNTTIPSIFNPYGQHLEAASIIKKALHIPVIAVGSIQTPERAEKVLEDGIADAVMMCRPFLADPHFAEKARTGRADDIAPCTRCSCCLGESETNHTFNCSVNPTALKQFRLRDEYAEQPESRNVLIIGGGFAGMKAAITAFDRGHKVTLADNTDSLGGMLKFTDYDEIKTDLRAHKDYLIRQVGKRDIRVLLNTEITPENVDDFGADVIIVAVGSKPVVPPIPGLDRPNVMHVLDMYPHIDQLGKKIVVVGGGLAGCESAVELARRGFDVTILEGLKGFARDANRMNSMALLVETQRLENLHAYDQMMVKEINDNGVLATDKDGKDILFEADSVVYGLGLKAQPQLYLDIYDRAETVTPIGDCVKPRRSMEAIREGFFAAMNIH